MIALKLQNGTTTLQVKFAWLQCNVGALYLQEVVDVLQGAACQLQTATMHLLMTAKNPMFVCRQWIQKQRLQVLQSGAFKECLVA